MQQTIPTLIIDPVVLFREGLRRILNEAHFQLVWCSDYPPVGPLPALADNSSPLLIIGTEVEEAAVQIAQVRRLYPAVRVVLLSDGLIPGQFVSALRLGADTIVWRQSSCEGLISTLKLVLGGAAVFPADLLTELLRPGPVSTTNIEIPAHAPAEGLALTTPLEKLGLSVRELRVLGELSQGLSNKEIGRALDITEATVKVHVKAILRKARARNRTQVAMWASRQNLLADLR